jgi:putative transposase
MSQLIATTHQATPVAPLCRRLGIAPASYYRDQVRLEPRETEADLRHRLQQLALDWPSYGYRRLTAALQREGWSVNHKRILRLMHTDNLLCLRQRAFFRTTDSIHGLPVYPNLLPSLSLTGLNQLWVADITYIRLRHEFVYLAAVLDAYSRRCIGWQLGRQLTASLAMAALDQALANRPVTPALVHHSDRGVQYASNDYTSRLQACDIRISMSRSGNPYDNAHAESFMKTLKYEEVYLQEYADFAEALTSIAHFIEQVYNGTRLHSALQYRPPIEFEELTCH